MIRINPLFSACLLWPLLVPTTASALSVEIQGTRLYTEIAGASCIDITGSYPGLTIEASESTNPPRICYNSNKVNSIAILNATFIATDPVKKDIVLKFDHDFPPGINGKIMSRAKLLGFFSTSNGVGVPTGDKLAFTAFFSQNNHDDAISEPFNLTVDDNLDTALFDYSVKEQYLISGPRMLKGALKIYFTAAGHKLTLNDRSSIVIDTGSTMADKLEAIAPAEETPAEEGADKVPASDEKQALPKGPIKFHPAAPEPVVPAH